MFKPIAWVEENPYTAAGIGAVIVIGAYLILFSGGSSPATTGTNNSGVVDAEIAAQSQYAQIQAQSQAANNAITGQLNLDAQDNAYKLAVAQLSAHAAETGQAYQYQIAAGQIGSDISIANLSAQVAELQTTTQAAVAENSTDAQVAIERLITDASVTNNTTNNATTVNVAQIINATQRLISTNQSNVAIQQSNDNAQVAIHQTDAAVSIAKSSGGNSTAGILGGIASLASVFI